MPAYVTCRLPDFEIERFLAEDCPYGDLTSAILEIGPQPGRIVFRARNETVACCTEEAARLFESLGCVAAVAQPTGAVVSKGGVLAEARGQAGALHMGWKAALNLLEAACGIGGRW
jgi:molybdenum transport protein